MFVATRHLSHQRTLKRPIAIGRLLGKHFKDLFLRWQAFLTLFCPPLWANEIRGEILDSLRKQTDTVRGE